MPNPLPHARTRILHLLKRSGGLTAGEVAKEVGVTAVAVRKQLSALEAEGFVATRSRPGSRGRPSTVYIVSEAGEAHFPQAYNRLAVDFLQDLAVLDGEKHLGRLFQLRNERLAKSYGTRLAGMAFPEAVQELGRARNDDGYMASVTRENGRLVLTEHNCPIYDVAQRFPLACQCEHELFEQVLHAPVIRELTLVEGGSACRYEFGAADATPTEAKSDEILSVP
jgi:DeoR family suf operon transcriptional repressor